MSDTFILTAIGLAAWIAIIFLETVSVGLSHPDGSKGVSVFPAIPVFPILAVLIGLSLNAFKPHLGTWTVGVFHLAVVAIFLVFLAYQALTKKQTNPFLQKFLTLEDGRHIETYDFISSDYVALTREEKDGSSKAPLLRYRMPKPDTLVFYDGLKRIQTWTGISIQGDSVVVRCQDVEKRFSIKDRPASGAE